MNCHMIRTNYMFQSENAPMMLTPQVGTKVASKLVTPPSSPKKPLEAYRPVH